MLNGKVAEGGPGDLKAGDKIAKSYLQALPRDKWFEIRLRDEDANSSLEQIRAQLTVQSKRFDDLYEEKRQKLQEGDDLQAGVLKMVKVFVAVKRRLQPGDKMAGRHGNNGVVAKIVA